MPIAVPKFVDEYPTYDANGYTTTNEEPELVNEILGTRTFERIGCIASGGEMLIHAFLKRGEQIVAVDHSYRALAATALKLCAIQSIPYTRMRQLLWDGNYTEVLKAFSDLAPHVPEKLKLQPFNEYAMGDMRREWCKNKPPRLSRKRIGNVTMLHGDLRDLGKFGLYDLLYISNAMEHTPRDRKTLKINDLVPLLRPGGLMLFTSSYNKTQAAPLEELCRVKGFRTVWHYVLARKQGEVQPCQTIA